MVSTPCVFCREATGYAYYFRAGGGPHRPVCETCCGLILCAHDDRARCWVCHALAGAGALVAPLPNGGEHQPQLCSKCLDKLDKAAGDVGALESLSVKESLDELRHELGRLILRERLRNFRGWLRSIWVALLWPWRWSN